MESQNKKIIYVILAIFVLVIVFGLILLVRSISSNRLGSKITPTPTPISAIASIESEINDDLSNIDTDLAELEKDNSNLDEELKL